VVRRGRMKDCGLETGETERACFSAKRSLREPRLVSVAALKRGRAAQRLGETGCGWPKKTAKRKASGGHNQEAAAGRGCGGAWVCRD